MTGTACGLGIEGSGWAAGGGLVVTNAHVVAGEDDTTVQVGGEGDELDATPVGFDPHNDVAILHVDGLTVRPLALSTKSTAGAAAAIMGYPENGPFDAEPGRVGITRVVGSQDAYGRGPVQREVTAFRGLVRSGNSGGPLVDGAGHVRPRSSRPRWARPRRRATGCPRDRAPELRRGAGPAAGVDRRCAADSGQAVPSAGAAGPGRTANVRLIWARRSSSPRSPPSDRTSHGSSRARSPSTRAGSRVPIT